MGISQAERDLLAGWPKADRRKAERRKDTETAKNWKGMERRICDRRDQNCLQYREKPYFN